MTDRLVRIGVIGPDRRRNGTGPFVARELIACNVQIVAVASRLAENGCAAAARLRDSGVAGVEAVHPAEALLERGGLDAIAICSPAETHAGLLRRALDRRLHVFCEKPLLWGPPGETAQAVLELVDGFASSGLVLHESAQWIYTLPAFERAYGAIDRERVRDLQVELAPPERAVPEMMREAFPHVASLLIATGGRGAPREVEWRLEPDGEALDLRFSVANASGTALRVGARFTHAPAQPRPAAYAIDGRWFRRRIGPGYAISMEGAGRVWPIDDPLAQSVAAFVEAVRAALAGAAVQRATASAMAAALNDALRLRVAATAPVGRRPAGCQP
jgi:hypothetical protein